MTTNLLQDFRAAGIEAALGCMTAIRPFQTGAAMVEGLELKADQTIVTEVDRISEAWATKVFKSRLPDIPLQREEGGWTSQNDSRYVVLVDPLDGTRPFRSGATGSTVIFSLWDNVRGQVVATIIGDPSTGRLWISIDSSPTVMSFVDTTGTRQERPCQVWDGSLGAGSTVLIDNFSGFKHNGRTVLTNAGCAQLVAGLNDQAAIMNFGSNGLHHALVANGNDSVVGAITTAIGGPWDCGGAHTVLRAGGVAIGFRIPVRTRKLIAKHPLDVNNYDLLAVANNPDTLDVLVGALHRSIRA